jgi:hypothetical protein
MLEGNKNEKQVYFNNIKGIIDQFEDGEKFCSLTLNVGHENKRQINLVIKKQNYDWLINNFNVGDKVNAKYYLTSRNKLGRWYTMATILDIEKL